MQLENDYIKMTSMPSQGILMWGPYYKQQTQYADENNIVDYIKYKADFKLKLEVNHDYG
jgi:hypothetical protein